MKIIHIIACEAAKKLIRRSAAGKVLGAEDKYDVEKHLKYCTKDCARFCLSAIQDPEKEREVRETAWVKAHVKKTEPRPRKPRIGLRNRILSGARKTAGAVKLLWNGEPAAGSAAAKPAG